MQHDIPRHPARFQAIGYRHAPNGPPLEIFGTSVPDLAVIVDAERAR